MFVATWDDGEPCIDAQPFFAALRAAGPAAVTLFAGRRSDLSLLYRGTSLIRNSTIP